MKAVIIGGGLGGLATALRLHTQGWQITVCEAGPSLGGKMNCLRRDGYSFDTGPSLITMPEAFADLYASAGENIHEHLSLIPVDPHAEYGFANGTKIVCPAGADRWREVIREVEPRDVAGFDKIHATGRKLFELSRRTFFRHSPRTPPAPSDIGALRFLPVRNAWGNYAATVERLVRNPLLRQIYNRYPTYVGSSPYLSPATLLIIPFLEREFGAWYIKGGLYKLIESLSRLLAERGVELWTGTKVEAIAQRDSRVAGVDLADGRFIEADLVVMNGDVATAGVLLRNARASQTSPHLRSLSGFVLLAGVASRPSGLNHHTVLFSSDYRREFDELFAGRFPADPTLYISGPAASDPSVAPPGGDAWFVMANAPANGDIWGDEEIRNATCVILHNLARHGLTLDRESIFETWHPGRIANEYLAPGGAIYGTHSHGWKQAFFRPANRSSTVKGLYFAGGSTHPGGGTPTVLMSAQIVSRMIQADMLPAFARAYAGT